jgi:plasmid stabilization system protein ParE
MTPVDFMGVALSEQDDAAAYYESQKPGLGLEFLDEVERAIERIRQFPNAWQKASRRSRRCRLYRFPYGLVYQVRQDRIVILAVMHLHRKPGYWLGRE